MIKDFKYFLEKGIVKKQSPDLSRAKFLEEESKLSFGGLIERLEKIGINKRNINSIIKDCYDILMELIRSKMLLKGFNASGYGAHESEVSYMRILEFKDTEIQFIDKLRYFRNGMIYYGKILDLEYAQKVVDFTKKVYSKLIIL
jgi:hypothetical protein